MSKSDRPADLRSRTKEFSLRVIRLFSALPNVPEAQIIGKQLLRAGTSVGAHYREATRARSNAEFISKIQIGLQELDESNYWLELLSESAIISPDRLVELRQETNELTAILTACAKNQKKDERDRMRTQTRPPSQPRFIHPSSFILLSAFR
jgi:four helix bundle protein